MLPSAATYCCFMEKGNIQVAVLVLHSLVTQLKTLGRGNNQPSVESRCLVRWRTGIQFNNFLLLGRMFLVLHVLCFKSTFLEIQGSVIALFCWCFNFVFHTQKKEQCHRVRSQSVLICIPLFLSWGDSSIFPFLPSAFQATHPDIIVCPWKTKKSLLNLSWVVSWPHLEEPQVWGRRRTFWRKSRSSTWLTPCEEALKLQSLVLVHLIRLLQQQVPPVVCQQVPQPEKTGHKVIIKKDGFWQWVLKVFSAKVYYFNPQINL